ncbi:MAG TPA: methyltransferase domain-containing protein [Acidimicrobiia bacterium]|nr:methyltransferase domain-containing protein [Acidimicrobiia bacterium]
MSNGIRDRLRRAAGGKDGSLAARLRQRRFEHIRSQLRKVPKPYSILDAGGTPGYWHTVGMGDEPGVEIVLINLKPVEVDQPNMRAVVGSATDMHQFTDRQFDVVFSNSVIEHVGGFAEQQRMADEVRRIGSRYYVQTPNRYFPMEPHFLFPFFALLPVPARAFLLRHLSLGWYSRVEDRQESYDLARSIRLLTRKEMRTLFPGSELVRERFLGMTKSFSVFGGDW